MHVSLVKCALSLAVGSAVAACSPGARIPETGEVSQELGELDHCASYAKVATAHLLMRKLSMEGRDGERAHALAQDLLARGEYGLVDALERIAEDDLRAHYWSAVGTWGEWYPECRELLDRFVRRRGQLNVDLAIRGSLHRDTWELLVKCSLDASGDGCTRIRAAYALAVHAPDEVFSRISALKEDSTSFSSPGAKYGKSQVVSEEFPKIVARRQELGWGKPPHWNKPKIED